MAALNKIARAKSIAEVLAIFLADLIAITSIYMIAVLIRTKALPLVYEGFPSAQPRVSLSGMWWILLVWIFFIYYEGLYTRRFSFWDEVKALLKASFFSTVGVFTLVSIGKLSEEISRTVIVLMGILALFILPSSRIIFKKVLRKMGLLKRRVLILGAGDTGRLILRALRREPHYGYEVMGFLDDDPSKIGTFIEGVKVHRGINGAKNYLGRCHISDLIIAMPGAGRERLQGIINDLQHKVERTLFVPDMLGIAVLGTGVQHFFHDEVLAFEIENNLSNPINIFIKRCFDICVCLLLVPLLIVPMALIAALIRIDSKGPAIFFQGRIGRRGKTFRCYKFRTMYEDAEERLGAILEKDAVARDQWEQRWKLSDDPRVTRMGRFLRTTSLDELPQILNVLKGEMSLVGPRPVTQEEIDIYYKDLAALCFRVLPGITGLWQVSGRSNTGYDYRISLDLWYVKNWNLWLDIVIILKTIRIVLKRDGAY
ncbi:MAG: undecaprenyl-phosphate galactose phosphotransferase WbaP [Nitrospirae bacterium]|nr:undecaprenyl-phosphate galactose phosphotransferase WbaP [Nitrospirota bacterium]